MMRGHLVKYLHHQLTMHHTRSGQYCGNNVLYTYSGYYPLLGVCVSVCSFTACGCVLVSMYGRTMCSCACVESCMPWVCAWSLHSDRLMLACPMVAQATAALLTTPSGCTFPGNRGHCEVRVASRLRPQHCMVALSAICCHPHPGWHLCWPGAWLVWPGMDVTCYSIKGKGVPGGSDQGRSSKLRQWGGPTCTASYR